MKQPKLEFSAICKTPDGKHKIVQLGEHRDANKARLHAESTIGGTDGLTPLAIVPREDAEKTVKRWRSRRPLPA